MGSNSFGVIFKVSTWGESHGKAIGALIDGCPAGLDLTEEDINAELKLRRPGKNEYTSSRTEPDCAHIYSGLFEGKTTGAPISIVIYNQDVDSSKYEPIKQLMRPGHAHFTYLEKYGIVDYRGGGRASARETACRVAAGAVAKKLLQKYGVHFKTGLKEIGGFTDSEEMMQAVLSAKEEGDSLGGVVECIVSHVPIGLGDPVYEKLQANLAKAMLSIPATKGFEYGAGFGAVRMKGSNHNDGFTLDDRGKIAPSSNTAGGILGGISTGEPLIFRVAFKPTSSIFKPQQSVDVHGVKQLFQIPEGSRHDPCVAIRAVPVVEAMAACVLVDAFLMKLDQVNDARHSIAQNEIGTRALDTEQYL